MILAAAERFSDINFLAVGLSIVHYAAAELLTSLVSYFLRTGTLYVVSYVPVET